MITDILVALTLLIHLALAQAIPIEFVGTQIRNGSMRAQAWVSNAVYIGGGLALTAAHCVIRPGWKMDVIKAGKAGRAKILHKTKGVVVLELTEPAYDGVTPATLPDLSSAPRTGDTLTHIYYDHDLKEYEEREVKWGFRSRIVDGFRVGMSGSGVFKDGVLVGIAELQNGVVWNVKDIVGAMEVRE